MVVQPVEPPAQRHDRGLVAGDQGGDHVVADRDVGHRRAVLVARGDDAAQHRGAFGTGGAGALDRVLQQRLEPAAGDAEAAKGRQAVVVELHRRQQQEGRRTEALAEGADDGAELLAALRRVGAEHRAQDDVERHGDRGIAHHDRVAGLEGREGLDRRVANHAAQRVQRLALEVRHQQPAVATQCPAGHARGAVLAQHAGRAGLEVDAVLVDRRGDDLLHDVGSPGHHADARRAHRKEIAIVPGVAAQGRIGVAQVAHHLPQAERRAGWQAADEIVDCRHVIALLHDMVAP